LGPISVTYTAWWTGSTARSWGAEKP